MAKTYRVAVIGRTGKGNYGHGLDVVWKSIDEVEIVAVADEDEKGRADAAKRLGARASYADYRPMLAKERPQFVSVQRELRDGDHATLARLRIPALGEELEDFADTAALLALCDLVISVDTSVAHVAGALADGGRASAK